MFTKTKKKMAPAEEYKLMKVFNEWYECNNKMKELELEIEHTVLAHGETVVMGMVRATYHNPTATIDYSAVEGMEGVTPELIKANSTVRVYPSWKTIAEEAGINLDTLPRSEKAAYVSIKLES